MNKHMDTIVAGYDTTWTMHPEDGSTVTADALREIDAENLVAELEASGYEASAAPDHDDKSLSWVYVTPKTALASGNDNDMGRQYVRYTDGTVVYR